MASGSVVRVRACAKVNLWLRVVGVRTDGYHELRTVFQSLALHDTLTIRARRGPMRLTCTDPACPVDDRNLVWRAAEQLWRATGRRGKPHGLAIHLTKRIPIEAGLGGGSSDAAAALRVLARRWRATDDSVRDTARALGADVAYFLEGGTVLGLDRGDVLFPLADGRAAWVVLAIPPFGVSTKAAYGWFDRRRRSRQSGWLNELQPAVVARHPLVGRLVRVLGRAGAEHAAMSGSGSAVFGLFATRREAARAVRRVERAHRRSRAGGGVRVILTRTVNRPMYQRLAGIPAHRIHFSFAPRDLTASR